LRSQAHVDVFQVLTSDVGQPVRSPINRRLVISHTDSDNMGRGGVRTGTVLPKIGANIDAQIRANLVYVRVLGTANQFWVTLPKLEHLTYELLK
jgi:hypothetical protein